MKNKTIDMGQITSLADALAPATKDGETVINVRIYDLKEGKYQPRGTIENASLKELSESIKAQGVLIPILARRLADNTLEIVAGVRRWMAATLAGQETVPTIIRNIDDKTALASALIENIDREKMSVLDEAIGVTRLVKETSTKEAAILLGKSPNWISKRTKIANSPDYVLSFAEKGFSSDTEGLYQLSCLAETDGLAARSLVDLWEKDPSVRRSLREQVLRISSPGKQSRHSGKDMRSDKKPPAKSEPERTTATIVPISIEQVTIENKLLVLSTNEGTMYFDLTQEIKEQMLNALNNTEGEIP
ncbi:putative chromosome-partitioning protein ParB [uncultured Desulfobacterium sp.]|uniref:Putative chromosome-partitioning protein ParB n=1 Tax=uncultured Desulfobacterium sp. TaxID=201089 RepID=A0A445MSJ9_9BACT|nr:putative chromosome-partitioning protein ParB [uncultured Desulfobacterium sp.]